MSCVFPEGDRSPRVPEIVAMKASGRDRWPGWLVPLLFAIAAWACAGYIVASPAQAKPAAATVSAGKTASAKPASGKAAARKAAARTLKRRIARTLRPRALPATGAAAAGLAAATAGETRPLDDAASSEELKDLLNANTVTLMSGCCVSGAYTAFGADLKDMVAAHGGPGDLRVLPILGGGAGSNVRDLLYLRSVDMAILNTDSLEYYEGKPLYRDLKSRIHYIAKLFNEEVHVFAGSGIGALQDLAGKRVGYVSSSAVVTGTLLFRKLGIAPAQTVEVAEADGAAMLRDGKLDAMLRVTGKPLQNVDHLKQIFPAIRLVPVPLDPALIETYLPTVLTHDDYPELIGEGQDVPSIATRTILAVFNWPATSDRYRRLSRFTRLLFDRFDDMRQSQNLHPKWAEVTLSADVSGLTRFRPAAELLAAASQPAEAGDEGLMSDFREFLASEPGSKARTEAGSNTEQLFLEFVRWQKQRR